MSVLASGDLSSWFSSLPTPALVVLGVVAAVQIPLQVFGLWDLSKRARVPGGRKWAWALLIVVGNLIGAIIYLSIGRSLPAEVADRSTTGNAEARQRALDRLYDKRDQ